MILPVQRIFKSWIGASCLFLVLVIALLYRRDAGVGYRVLGGGESKDVEILVDHGNLVDSDGGIVNGGDETSVNGADELPVNGGDATFIEPEGGTALPPSEEIATPTPGDTTAQAGEETEFQPAESAESLRSSHPILKLVAQANIGLLAEQEPHKPVHINEAAFKYRERRDRHPPPYFDKWVEWANEHDAVIEEHMFDQIYDDLEPFWAIHPKKIKSDSEAWPHVLAIRNGEVEERSTVPKDFSDWLGGWRDMIRVIPKEYRPDVNLPFNADDGPHIFVPWEQVQSLRDTSQASRSLTAKQYIIETYSNYTTPIAPPSFERFPDAPSETNLWLLARDTCAPNSTVHDTDLDLDFTTPPEFLDPPLEYTQDGYISDWQASKSVCHNPHLRNLHGYFVNAGPGSRIIYGQNSTDRLTTRHLFPVFSVCKLQGVNNDILVPSPVYWRENIYTEKDPYSWSKKASKTRWRGTASGGFNNETNWTRFHRHRFVSMLNGTQVSMTLAAADRGRPAHVPGGNPRLPHNFPIPKPDSSIYPLAALDTLSSSSPSPTQRLGQWIDSWASAKFVNLVCWPPTDFFKNQNGRFCNYTSDWYTTSDFEKGEIIYRNKYLHDVDGMSYSGRWRQILQSSSLPIKATIWAEWQDSRLVPWRHFVPMDNTGVDLYGIMQFFVGYQPPESEKDASSGVGGNTNIGTTGDTPGRVDGHDDVAKRIASQGRDWTNRVLRHEDMVLYMWRLILEYARLCEDRRDRLGFIGDLS